MQNVTLFLALIAFALLAGRVLITHEDEREDDPQERLRDWMDERRRDDR